MRIVLQRVARAEVRVDGAPVGTIGQGLLLLVGFRRGDGDAEIEHLADKVVNLRIFADDAGKMNRSVADIGGELLAVSQFTLYADARKGRRPSFVDAAAPAEAIPLYERFVARLRSTGLAVATGIFGAMMDVELVNDGPVTIILESPDRLGPHANTGD